VQEPRLEEPQPVANLGNGELSLGPIGQFVFGGVVRKESLGWEEGGIFGELSDQSFVPDQRVARSRAAVDGPAGHRQATDGAHIKVPKYEADFVERQSVDERFLFVFHD
jgi:hypothetical protein